MRGKARAAMGLHMKTKEAVPEEGRGKEIMVAFGIQAAKVLDLTPPKVTLQQSRQTYFPIWFSVWRKQDKYHHPFTG